MISAGRFNVVATALLLGLAAVAWYLSLAGLVGMGSMAISIPVYLATWVVMVVAMMFPAIAPIVFSLARVVSVRPGGRLQVAAFLLGYVVVWTAAGVLPLALYLASRGMIAGMAGGLGTLAVGGVLVAAGLYQLTPLKNACLKACRTPLGFLAGHDLSTFVRALRGGVSHGGFCLACCWALMAVLVVVGLMNLAWMALLAVLILAEKNWRHGLLLSRLAGLGAVGGGMALLAAQAL